MSITGSGATPGPDAFATGGSAAAVPPPGTWYIEPIHSSIGFVARFQHFGRIQGRFGLVSGVVWIGERPQESSASVSVEVGSIDTGIAKRNAHLTSPDFFDAAEHPQIVWHGSSVEPAAGGRDWIFHGELTIKTTTRPVSLVGRFLGEEPYPFGDARQISFTARATIDRFDFGVEGMPPIPGAGLFVGREVDIVLDVALIDTDIRFFTHRFLAEPR
ncbi:YceI family protein [Allonocardiopsis opalescens]|uniref:Polyisoprenoid-binding protein YceI n=1 Tax=Allonocardiopsis opalescens TaxID=1144618 RepID=A0A2T0Q4W0_9ACTN|nr:YceI family protein [Allonocardiopsis opalescens]PRX98820.1 polyisoprenoid-binding protein YceI [Allonocardiopsis opalescens]